MKPKATTKVTVIAHKSTKEITWNHRKNINPKDGRKKKKKNQWEKDYFRYGFLKGRLTRD